MVKVKCDDGRVFLADYAVVAVLLEILKKGMTFASPAAPEK
jgi:hypothetical protein